MTKQIKPCSAKALQYLNDRYEYRAIAVASIDHIMLESKLSDGAKVLWMILYRGASPFHDLKCVASASFLEEKTGKSKATLWRYIRELREGGYLEVETRHTEEKTQLPNIYGPRLPESVVRNIKNTATKREEVSIQILEGESNKTIRDYISVYKQPETIDKSNSEIVADNERAATVRNYEKTYSGLKEGADNCKAGPLNESNHDLVVTVSSSESVLEETRVNTAPDEWKQLREALKNQDPLTKDGISVVKQGSLKTEIGEGVISETENTITPSEKDYTTTGKHSRSSWIILPHVRTQVHTKLRDLGFDNKKSKALIREMDYSIMTGAMRDWPIKKAINVCLSLIKTGRWTTPELMV